MPRVKASSKQMKLPSLVMRIKVSNFSGAIDDMSCTLGRLGAYSRELDLAVNATKTKWMLVSSPQMSFHHSLIEKLINIQFNGKALEPMNVTQLFPR